MRAGGSGGQFSPSAISLILLQHMLEIGSNEASVILRHTFQSGYESMLSVSSHPSQWEQNEHLLGFQSRNSVTRVLKTVLITNGHDLVFIHQFL